MIEISERARELVWSAEQYCKDVFRRVDSIEMVNQQRVLEAFWSERVSTRHFAPTTGYGYDDIIIDGPPRVTDLARSCIMASDVVLVPVRLGFPFLLCLLNVLAFNHNITCECNFNFHNLISQSLIC